MGKTLLEALEQIQGGELLNISLIRFKYHNVEWEFSINDEKRQEYVVSGVILKKNNLAYNEVVKYMTAHVATDGYRYYSNLEYAMSKNEDNTYNLTLSLYLSFHFSQYIQNKVDYLTSYVLEDLTGRIKDYYHALELINKNINN